MTRNKTYQVDELRIQELLSKEAAYDRIQTLLTTLGFDASTPEQCADICEALVTDKPQTLDMLGMQTKISIVKSMLESTCTQQECTDLHALNANIRCFGLVCTLEHGTASNRYHIGIFDSASKSILDVFEP